MLEIVEKVEPDDAMICFDIIKIIREREELSQTFIDFLWVEFDKGSESYVVNKKVMEYKLIEEFFKLDETFILNASKYLDIQGSKDFFNNCSVETFFSLPIYRKKVLDSISASIPKDFNIFFELNENPEFFIENFQ